MTDYDGHGVEDDRVAAAARRIVRQYHLEQHDFSEDSASAAPPVDLSSKEPDNIHSLRQSLDDMSTRIGHMERLLEKREAVFMAAIERIERNLAKSDGQLDALSAELATIVARPVTQQDAVLSDMQDGMDVVVRDVAAMMMVGRALLDEARELNQIAVARVSHQYQDGATEVSA